MSHQIISEHLTPKTLLIAAGTATALYTAGSLYRELQLPPGPIGLPLLGRIPWLDPSHFNESLEIMRQQYGPIYSYRAGQRLMIIVSSADLMRDMFKDENFCGRLVPRTHSEAAHGCGIAITEGATWRDQRRLCMRVLRDAGFGKTTSIDTVYAEIENIFLSIEQQSNNVDAFQMFAPLSNSVIATLMFGRRYANEDKRFDQFMQDNAVLFRESSGVELSLLFPALTPLLAWRSQSKVVTQAIESGLRFIKEEVAAREAAFKESEAEPQCVCDAYIQERRRYEAKGDFETYKPFHLIRVALEMMSAGTDTVARSMEWLMVLMSLYPEAQLKVHAEIDEAMGKERRVEMSDRQQLHYTQAVIDDSLRYASTAFAGLPHRAIRQASFHGYRIPSDAMIVPFIYGAHRDPTVWQRPNHFYPEHFLNSEGQYRPSPNLVPFSVGKRNCPGESLAKLEIFLTFVAVMQRYRVKLSSSCEGQGDKILRGLTKLVREAGMARVDFVQR